MATDNVGPVFGAISVDGVPNINQSVEVARIWIKNAGHANFFIQPDNIKGPEMFGELMTDCIRHAAIAFSQARGITEGEALDRIWEGLDNERDFPSEEPICIEPYSKDLD